MDKKDFFHAGDLPDTLKGPVCVPREISCNQYASEHYIHRIIFFGLCHEKVHQDPIQPPLVRCQLGFQLFPAGLTEHLFLTVQFIEGVRPEHDAFRVVAVAEP